MGGGFVDVMFFMVWLVGFMLFGSGLLGMVVVVIVMVVFVEKCVVFVLFVF